MQGLLHRVSTTDPILIRKEKEIMLAGMKLVSAEVRSKYSKLGILSLVSRKSELIARTEFATNVLSAVVLSTGWGVSRRVSWVGWGKTVICYGQQTITTSRPSDAKYEAVSHGMSPVSVQQLWIYSCHQEATTDSLEEACNGWMFPLSLETPEKEYVRTSRIANSPCEGKKT